MKEEVSSMTIEQAFYFKIMLICGYSDELFEYIENTLNERASYEEVIVDLAFRKTNAVCFRIIHTAEERKSRF